MWFDFFFTNPCQRCVESTLSSSAAEFLAQMEPEEAKRIWREYPLDEYGKGWDDPKM